jgi:hypothetical protein
LKFAKSSVGQTLKNLENEPNMVKVHEPFFVVGDIHGQYYDLVQMLEKAGHPSKIK